MADSISDLQMVKMREWLVPLGVPANILNGTLEDLAHEYYYQRNSFTPPNNKSTADNEKDYYRFITGASPSLSISDLENAFYDFKAVPAGSLQDRAYFWWSGVIT